MSRSEFFSQVLAPTGHICIMGLMSDSSQSPRQSFYASIEEAEDTINSLASAGREVYFACATFKDPAGKRSAKNAEAYKSFFMDIDCGPGKPYETQKDGLLALQKYLEDTRLPMPTVVDSGRGLHLDAHRQELLQPHRAAQLVPLPRQPDARVRDGAECVHHHRLLRSRSDGRAAGHRQHGPDLSLQRPSRAPDAQRRRALPQGAWLVTDQTSWGTFSTCQLLSYVVRDHCEI